MPSTDVARTMDGLESRELLAAMRGEHVSFDSSDTVSIPTNFVALLPRPAGERASGRCLARVRRRYGIVRCNRRNREGFGTCEAHHHLEDVV